MPQINSVIDLIRFHEGFTSVAKPDAKGKWEWGYGFDIAAPAPGAPIPVITQALADSMLPAIVATAEDRACNDLGVFDWESLDPVRQAVLTDTAYQIGGRGLSEFIHMLAAIRSKEWQSAAAEMLSSELARETPSRAKMNATMLLTGQWPVVN